ncbi:ABC transporter permease [Arthrobacter sp. AK01]|uniref:ABC transporter permease n=1 Tax=Micrococcaceae TaxID=1268 RepID=UPI001E5A9789|nr:MULTISPECIES: ABC transporter permease [Micrococcaceae]MCD4852028.1 ABC transporter permease [Arthrobacter sp. AK01]MCP1413753.1 NitT/TauT family transport system permease protein [Paenarthrobacter sp. A20]
MTTQLSKSAPLTANGTAGQKLNKTPKPKSVLVSVLPPAIVLVLVLTGWSVLAGTVYGDRNYLLPRPEQVLQAIVENPETLLQGLRITFLEAAAGFALAIIVGFAAAIIMSQSKMLERSLYPYAVLLQTVPVVAVAPIIVLWFGYNQTAVIVIAFMISVFPILNNTLLGLLSTDRNHRDLFRMHHASRTTEFLQLRLPSALPNIFAGLRVSAGLAVVGAIVGEFIIGSGGEEGGLGVKVLFAQSRLATGLLFAEVLAATLLGFAFFIVVTLLGNRLIKHWHESALKDDA